MGERGLTAAQLAMGDAALAWLMALIEAGAITLMKSMSPEET
jgi:hypothetical protein